MTGAELADFLYRDHKRFEENIPKIRQHLIEYLSVHKEEAAKKLAAGEDVLVESEWGITRVTMEDVRRYAKY